MREPLSKLREEKGQVLPIALAALALGSVLVGSFLHTTSVHKIASRNYSGSIMTQYSSGAGAEDAIWRLTNGTLADQMAGEGDYVTYSLSEEINGLVPEITVTRGAGNVSIEYDIDSIAGSQSINTDIIVEGGNVTIDTWKIQKE